MASTYDLLTDNIVRRVIHERAEHFSIPSDEIEIRTREDAALGTVVRTFFRTPGGFEKYQSYMTIGQPDKIQSDIDIGQDVDKMLQNLEDHWLKNGGDPTFYKNHAFFYWHQDNLVEVQCTVCHHTERISADSSIIDTYKDVLLMKLLPEAHAKCDCAAGRYAPVSRPRMHGL
jgi:hypothetical protein